MRRAGILMRLFTVLCVFGLTAVAQDAGFHERLHGHDHAVHEAAENFGAPHQDEDKPCEACAACRIQNHFAFHTAPAGMLPAVFHGPLPAPETFYEFLSSFSLPENLLGRAPPRFS